MLRRLLPIGSLIALAACGSSQGEPIEGDIAFAIDDQIILPTAGAAISDTDAGNELIIIGTRDISCETTLGSPLRKGTYAAITIRREVAAQADANVSVIRVASSGTLINGAAATVVIDRLDDRAAGTLTFTVMDDAGTTLGVTGSFDVVNCSP